MYMYNIYISIYLYIYGVSPLTLTLAAFVGGSTATAGWSSPRPASAWPLHDVVITNFVVCIAYKREVGRGVVYCLIIVQ